MAVVILQVRFLPTSYASSSPSPTVAPSKANAPGAKKNVVTFGTQTSSATKPDGRGYYSFGSSPGGRILDHIAVINYSAQPITLLIRPVDAVNTPQGGFAARPINQTPRDIGTWIALPASDLTVTLAPRTDLIIPFMVEVPKNASPGDHIGVLTATLESSVISKTGQKLHLLQTIGTRVFLRVNGPLHPGFAIENLRVRYTGVLNPISTGHAILTYTVRNVGNVALGGRQIISISGLFGTKRSATHVAEVQLLLPGNAVNESVTISGIVPEFRDTGRVSISPLTIPGTAQPASGPYKADVSFWAIPWTLLAIVAAVILLLIAIWRRGQRLRRRRKSAQGPQEPTGSTGQTDSSQADGAEPVAAIPASAPNQTVPAQAPSAPVGPTQATEEIPR